MEAGGILIDGFASLLTVTAGVSLLVAFFSLDMLCQAVIWMNSGARNVTLVHNVLEQDTMPQFYDREDCCTSRGDT